jgi:hypothetical protein
MKCRFCSTELKYTFVDLGSAPPSNAFLGVADLSAPEKTYPLRVLVCHECWLAQTEDFANADELFSPDYAYFSGFSATWLAHSERYVHDMAQRFGLNSESHVVEVASNDGYLLQYVRDLGVPCTGVDPTASTAAAAREKGLEIIEKFFGAGLAGEMAADGKQADLMTANNVLAHVPDISDFVSGFAVLMKEDGVATFEFPHLMRLVAENQFDTIYHEHFSYLSLTAVNTVFEANGLTVFDVQELPTHGGSLRVFAQRTDTGGQPVAPAVEEMLAREAAAGMTGTDYYSDFQSAADTAKNGLLRFLLNAKAEGKTVAGYGAAAKGNTLLNYAGVKPDLLSFIADRNPAKQGLYTPGSRIPIVGEERIQAARPDIILILPWNIGEEVMTQLEYARGWDARFATAIPELRVF